MYNCIMCFEVSCQSALFCDVPDINVYRVRQQDQILFTGHHVSELYNISIAVNFKIDGIIERHAVHPTSHIIQYSLP